MPTKPPKAPPIPAGQPIRDSKGRLLPGAVINPKGRPRTGFALTEMIRECMDRETMHDLVGLVLDVAHLRPVVIDVEYLRARATAREAGLPDPPRQGEAVQPTLAEAQKAWEWLAKWGFQPPPQGLEITSPQRTAMDPSKLSQEELDALEAMHRKMLTVVDAESIEE